jgi:prepilin-type N-terminal cleavage/methylation domain-containing protein
MQRTARHGFTLIEMLVVISIIAVLAAMLIPAVSFVRRRANDVKCANQLKNGIGAAMLVYMGEYDDKFPTRLNFLTLASKIGDPLPARTLVCPLDRSNGSDSWINRLTAWHDLRYLHDAEGVPVSYSYEVSDDEDPSRYYPPIWIDDTFEDLDPASRPPAVSWYRAKKHQRDFGFKKSVGGTMTFAPMSSDTFPILRCFHHNKWTEKKAQTEKRVLNLTWNMGVFWSTVYWEKDVNPDDPATLPPF